MLEVQHIGIPTTCFDKTIEWYKLKGYPVTFETKLSDGVRVAFIEIFKVTLEFYEAENSNVKYSNIKQIVINNLSHEKLLISPTGEEIILQLSNKEGIDHIVLNTDSIHNTFQSLQEHGFSYLPPYYVNGKVKFKLNRIQHSSIGSGIINHIAFNENNLDLKHSQIVEMDIPIVEGPNFLPFFENGVRYFVTENYNGLRLEYNQILRR
ncbi:MAG: hypothetical protein JXR64_07980 [Spirochaetales bacterium]|nr:hypothetical protein [Spirochaetales bacterium]